VTSARRRSSRKKKLTRRTKLAETTSTFTARQAYGVLATTVFVVLLLLFINSVAELLLLVFVAVLLAIYLESFIEFLSRRLGMGRPIGLIVALLITSLIIGLVGLLIVPPVITQFRELIGALPRHLSAMEAELARLAQEGNIVGRILGPIGETQEGTRYLDRVFEQAREFFGDVVPYVFSGIGVLIHLASVLIMGIYFAAKPSLYREGVIALTPPAYRELARDILEDLGHTLRAWLVGLGISMFVLGVLTWIGLLLLDVPYSLAFAVFTGIAVIVPFFGTITSTLLPALFVIGTAGVGKALLVMLLGVIVHVFEANVVAPMVFEKKVELPPVLTILSVLVMAKLLGVVGLLVAVPVLATVTVLVRRIFIHRVLEGKGFHRIERDAPALISLPTGDGVLVHPSASEVSVPAVLEG
jgi:predicted PurR-regulated permease PerM